MLILKWFDSRVSNLFRPNRNHISVKPTRVKIDTKGEEEKTQTLNHIPSSPESRVIHHFLVLTANLSLLCRFQYMQRINDFKWLTINIKCFPIFVISSSSSSSFIARSLNEQIFTREINENNDEWHVGTKYKVRGYKVDNLRVDFCNQLWTQAFILSLWWRFMTAIVWNMYKSLGGFRWEEKKREKTKTIHYISRVSISPMAFYY